MFRLPTSLVLLALAGCHDASAHDQDVRRAFTEFQDALFAGDQAALRRLVTRGSRPAIEQLPFGRLRDKEPLAIRGIRARHGRFVVDVEDPNQPPDSAARFGVWVIVREGGRHVVDLIETTAHHHRDLDEPGAKQFVPGGVDAEQIDQIRQAIRRRPQ